VSRTGESVRVRVPATSANLGPGFDCFGLALALYDEVSARITPAGLKLQVTGEGADTAQAGEQHLVIRAMRAAFDVIGSQPAGIALSCQNKVPHGFGLGSSAAAIVAGLVSARALAGPAGLVALPDSRLLSLATELEGHPDNVAACLYGGLTLAWRGAGGVAAARLEPLPEIRPVVCVPTTPLATEVARQVLPASVSHADAAANSARAALLVTALTSQPDFLLAATEDFLHQSYRADSMPATTALISKLRAASIAAVVSGAGPSVLALPTDHAVAAEVARLAESSDHAAAARLAESSGQAVGWQVLPLAVDGSGARLLDGAAA
jgi:homoserine kinase